MKLPQPLREAVIDVRRAAGRAAIARVQVDGIAPQAVLTALRKATPPRRDPTERDWIERVELTRALLLRSSAELEFEDLGAGDAHAFDIGAGSEVRTRNVVHKTLGHMARRSTPSRWVYLLFRLIRELQPESVLEMGACVGISAAAQAAALELNGHGRLVSLEGADVLAERSRHTLEELQLSQRAEVRLGHFGDTLEAAAAELAPVGFVFVDGNHVESATVDYKDQLVPHMAPESVLVFDDIDWSPGMINAWKRIKDDERFALTVDLGPMGLAVLSASASARHDLRVWF